MGRGSGTTYTSSDGYKYTQFSDLATMVNYMNSTSNEPNVNVEIAGYVLEDDNVKTYYYVLDYTGNTNCKSNNEYTYNIVSKRATFNGKNIVAEIHTHPKSYYSDPNFQYDGNSYEDYKTALHMGVPVYSIGPTTVSVITGASVYATEDQFNDLAKGRYTTDSVGIIKYCNANPFYWALTRDWLLNPVIYTAK